mmetsp:Transcript_12569/g.29792  ORF Transcript_12569/g.29792 Transcript_12569/m.29792 type:complete len:302 (+) Transcript_12569:441-1346(+)
MYASAGPRQHNRWHLPSGRGKPPLRAMHSDRQQLAEAAMVRFPGAVADGFASAGECHVAAAADSANLLPSAASAAGHARARPAAAVQCAPARPGDAERHARARLDAAERHARAWLAGVAEWLASAVRRVHGRPLGLVAAAGAKLACAGQLARGWPAGLFAVAARHADGWRVGAGKRGPSRVTAISAAHAPHRRAEGASDHPAVRVTLVAPAPSPRPARAPMEPYQAQAASPCWPCLQRDHSLCSQRRKMDSRKDFRHRLPFSGPQPRNPMQLAVQRLTKASSSRLTRQAKHSGSQLLPASP